MTAAAAYVAVVFAVGFVLGALRVTLIAPRVGALTAVAIELPLILAASWFVCGWVLRRWAVPWAISPRAAMGVAALALLMVTEFALAMGLGQGAGDYVGALATPAGATGLAGQIAFAAMPLVRRALR